MNIRTKQLSNKQSLELVNLAREYWSQNPNSTISSIAKALQQHKLSLSPDQARYLAKKAKANQKAITHGNSLLTDTQEAVLVTYCQLRSESKTPISKQQLGEIVRQMLGYPQSWVSLPFTKRFLKKHKKFISPRKGKELTKARNSADLEDSCKDFTRYMITYFKSHVYHPDVIFNVDECQLDLHTYEVKLFFHFPFPIFEGFFPHSLFLMVFTGLIHSNNLNRTDVELKSYGKRISLIPFISADGKCHLIVFVLQGRENANGMLDFEGVIHERTRTTRNFPPIYYLTTPTGRISGQDWDIIYSKFLSIISPWLQSREALLYLDNLGAHITPTSMTESLASHVAMIFLPPNTTHFLQPLDNLAFLDFKRTLKQDMRCHFTPNGFKEESFTQVMLKVSHDILLTTFQKKTLQQSFLNTGLSPFNPEKIMENVNRFLGLFFSFIHH